MTAATAAGHLAERREQVTVDALLVFAGIVREPVAVLDALSAIAPDRARMLIAILADRDETTPELLTQRVERYRIETIAAFAARKAVG